MTEIAVSNEARHIREQFPDKKEAIDLLIEADPEFRSLSDDYDACVNALRYWSKSRASEAKTRVNEYRVLVRELEEEIIQALEAVTTQRLD